MAKHAQEAGKDADLTMMMTQVLPRTLSDFEPEARYLRERKSQECAVRVIRWKEVHDRLGALRRFMPDVKWVYDLSSEADPEVLRRLKKEGVDFSALGGSHLERLDILGAPMTNVSLTAADPLADAVRIARKQQPKSLSVGSLSALETLIEEGCVPREDWRPTLQLVVRQSSDQPLLNPNNLGAIVKRAKEAGFASFGISVVVENDLLLEEDRTALIRVMGAAALSCAQAGVRVDTAQILGGLTDTYSLGQSNMTLESYITSLSDTLSQISNAIITNNAGSSAALEVEAGQVLLGHFPTLAEVVNVKRGQRDDGIAEVFVGTSVYSDIAGHLYRKAPMSVCAVPDPGAAEALSTRLVEVVIHGITCDSIDSVYEADGKTLCTYYVPENLKGGCFLAFYGKRLADGATDFNSIPPATVVIHDQDDTHKPYTLSPLADYQAPQFAAARQFFASPSAARIKRVFQETIQAIDSKQQVGGIYLGDLATDPALRLKRQRRVGEEFLRQNPDAAGTITFLCVQTYAAQARNVREYTSSTPPFRNGVVYDAQTLRQEARPGLGVDRILLPIKSFCDPVGLVCQAAAGFGHDAASAGEMWMSSQVGVDPSCVIVSHPHKTRATLAMMRDPQYKPWAVTIDSREELERLCKEGISKDTVIFIRFKATGTNVVANLSAKFGHPVKGEDQERKIIELLEYARDQGFHKFGWAFHVGTQSSSARDYGTALKQALRLTKMAKDLPRPILVRHFNVGGGLCDENVAIRNGLSSGKQVIVEVGGTVARFREAVERIIECRAEIEAEFGRVTCALAGFMMAQVISGREAERTQGAVIRWAATRQGILSGNDHDDQYYGLRPVAEHAGRSTWRCRVLGSSNRPNDIFPSIDADQAHVLPMDLKRGDWLMTPGGIAYGWNASGAIDGIDPGRLVAYYIDEQDKIHFIESPWSNRESLRNEYLRKHIEASRSGTPQAVV